MIQTGSRHERPPPPHPQVALKLQNRSPSSIDIVAFAFDQTINLKVLPKAPRPSHRRGGSLYLFSYGPPLCVIAWLDPQCGRLRQMVEEPCRSQQKTSYRTLSNRMLLQNLSIPPPIPIPSIKLSAVCFPPFGGGGAQSVLKLPDPCPRHSSFGKPLAVVSGPGAERIFNSPAPRPPTVPLAGALLRPPFARLSPSQSPPMGTGAAAWAHTVFATKTSFLNVWRLTVSQFFSQNPQKRST